MNQMHYYHIRVHFKTLFNEVKLFTMIHNKTLSLHRMVCSLTVVYFILSPVNHIFITDLNKVPLFSKGFFSCC